MYLIPLALTIRACKSSLEKPRIARTLCGFLRGDAGGEFEPGTISLGAETAPPHLAAPGG
ncbi:hypothetical protein Slit_2534 [Sideroxydans lithotrophicus ES-1]|uniref:Uncharacterized protein n=1 Tax=Sideroxydans lithotrophicus (strain ES-1) TaxID=580332 RepID=D5CN62_SIDLE|nr:hypothetical protein Slit_2534 [Sideroxydans lithotrophicus ES-1]